MMKKTWLKVVLAICVILLIIASIHMLKNTEKGTPDTEQKGNPLNK